MKQAGDGYRSAADRSKRDSLKSEFVNEKSKFEEYVLMRKEDEEGYKERLRELGYIE